MTTLWGFPLPAYPLRGQATRERQTSLAVIPEAAARLSGIQVNPAMSSVLGKKASRNRILFMTNKIGPTNLPRRRAEISVVLNSLPH